ncbi:MAG: hypothetical protein KHX03_04305 [Clostridium sp.]|nr:hypothetical protein [Clostridium sp.]
MKRFLVIPFVMLMLSTNVMAEVVMAPQWSEFCPPNYLSAKASKWNTNSDYWYNRRVQFENTISQCSSYKGADLKSCYSQIRESELNKNKAWNLKVEQREKEHQEYIEYRNKQQAVDAVQTIIRTIKY